MRITERKLRQIVKSCLLSEIGLGIGMDPTGSTMPKGMKRDEYKQLESADPEDFKTVVQILDPTGAASIPDIPPALTAFQKDPSLMNKVFLVLAVLAVIPVAGKLAKLGSKGLKPVRKALIAAKKGIPTQFVSKADEGIKAIDKVAAGGKTGKVAANIKKISVADARKQYPDAFIKSNIDSSIVKRQRSKSPNNAEDAGVNNLTTHEEMVDEFNEMKKMHDALGDYSVKPLMIGKEGDKTFVVMEKIKGELLPQKLENLRRKYQKPMSKYQSGDIDAILAQQKKTVKVTDTKDAELIKSIKSQFSEIHKQLKSSGYHHGDLSAGGNVMITPGGKLKLIDPSQSVAKKGTQGDELVEFLKQLNLFDVS